MSDESEQKFEFDIDFQWEILKYTLTDKDGYKLIGLYEYTYFDLIDQQIIARIIKNHFAKNKRIPALPVLNEGLRRILKTKDYAQDLLPKDRDRIKKKLKKISVTPAKDGETILEDCKLFASYVELKKQLEVLDINDYQRYPTYLKGIQKAINVGMALDETQGSFLVSAHRNRLAERHQEAEGFPSPFRQIDAFTNAGGYTAGSIIVFLDKPKGGKTAVLIQAAINSMMQKTRRKRDDNKTRRKVIYFDLENGLTAIQTRLDQSIMGINKMDVLSGEYDKKLSKKYRDIARMGGEIYTIRLPAKSTTLDFQKVMDDLYSEYGLKFDVGVIDYVALMGSISNKEDETQRIGEAYIDVKNWANKNMLDLVITAHHVPKPGYVRRATKYISEDLAMAISIVEKYNPPGRP